MHERKSFRIMGIDPGVANMGVAILDYCEKTDTYKVVNVFTIVTIPLLRKTPQLGEVLTERGAKLYLLEEELVKTMNRYEPETVASEAPFLGRFPQAFASLVECLVSIRRAYYKYRPYLMLTTIDPPTVKMNVGVAGRSNDKDDMYDAVRKLPNVDFNGFDVESLDEHSIDAIAVAITKMRMLLGTNETYEKKKKKKKSKRKRK